MTSFAPALPLGGPNGSSDDNNDKHQALSPSGLAKCSNCNQELPRTWLAWCTNCGSSSSPTSVAPLVPLPLTFPPPPQPTRAPTTTMNPPHEANFSLGLPTMASAESSSSSGNTRLISGEVEQQQETRNNSSSMMAGAGAGGTAMASTAGATSSFASSVQSDEEKELEMRLFKLKEDIARRQREAEDREKQKACDARSSSPFSWSNHTAAASAQPALDYQANPLQLWPSSSPFHQPPVMQLNHSLPPPPPNPTRKPKRPLSAYNYFFKDERSKILSQQNPNQRVSFQEMGKQILKRWNSLSIDELQKYKLMAQADAERYMKEMQEYRRNSLSPLPFEFAASAPGPIVGAPPAVGALGMGNGGQANSNSAAMFATGLSLPQTAGGNQRLSLPSPGTEHLAAQPSVDDSPAINKKRPAEDVIDLSNTGDEEESDEEDATKMPAVKRRSTGGAVTEIDEALLEAKEVEERKQHEKNAMYMSHSGRAFMLVERLIKVHEAVIQHDANLHDLTMVGQDDLVFLAERFLGCQTDFRLGNKPTHVSLAYHYTREQHLRSIRQDGLLSHPERQSNNIHAKHAAYFGEGIYCGNNPYAFRNMGDTGLVVAILKGQEERVGQGGTQDPNVNSVIGNKRGGNPFTDEIVLRTSAQVLPILRFSRNIVMPSGSLDEDGNALLWRFHKQIQTIMDEFFNGNVPTTVEPVIPPFSGRGRRFSGGSAAAAAAAMMVNPTPIAAMLQGPAPATGVPTPAGTLNFPTPFPGNAAGVPTAAGTLNFPPAPAPAPQTQTDADRRRAYAMQDAARAAAGLPPLERPTATSVTTVPPPITVTSPPKRSQSRPSGTIAYTAPACLVTAASCTRRVKTLARSEECPICFGKLHRKGRVLQLLNCCHLFHQECLHKALEHDSKCPKCRAAVSKDPQGRSPSGTLTISHTGTPCGGFNDGDGSIVLRYSFPGGVQLPYHETPGQHYNANNRVAYLPNNAAGRNLLKRIKFAWSKGLLFSIGTSLTTGRKGQIVWSSVHQKSSLNGWSSLNGGAHGFPDPNYFRNVAAELNALGVPPHEQLNN